MAAICVQVEGLGLHACRLDQTPFEIGLGELGEGRIALILAHRLDALRTILGLLGSGDVGQPGQQ